MKKTFAIVGLLSAATMLNACAGEARDPSQFTTDTEALLATRSDQIKACYDQILTTDSAVGGSVAISFTIEKKTGAFLNVALVPEKTTAPKALADCVVNAVGGLVLTPPDLQQGDGTFSWLFTANPPAQTPAPAAPATPPAG